MPTLSSTPAATIDITESLVRKLLEEQRPSLSGMSIQIMESGWDNVMIKAGEEYALRMPRRDVAESLILNEQRWLPWLAPQLPLPVPEPIFCGKPTAYYPYHWSLQNWIEGLAADVAPPSPRESEVLASFLQTLHSIPVPEGAPRNPVRDCALAAKAEDMALRMEMLGRETQYITDAVKYAWDQALIAPSSRHRCFIAGDMHARNILTHEGKLAAIIDWGDMCAGDPATDFMSVWGLFEDQAARRTVFSCYEADESLVRRAKGWAIFSGVILLHTGRADTPRHARMGEIILRRITADG